MRASRPVMTAMCAPDAGQLGERIDGTGDRARRLGIGYQRGKGAVEIDGHQYVRKGGAQRAHEFVRVHPSILPA